ncbi:hypothetical protein ACFSKU_21745 [Pontibacter silvestris]|uniref:Uncharacterized protein n=1 Tax=Pontibacter silvestris TaxID=2305183 RepID=A0ABW4X3F6_9BACT|nr:hypothetical protein [Pontibacter silvestris]MCC9138328.1 hypothetical protein [Pontibacter silvestris]
MANPEVVPFALDEIEQMDLVECEEKLLYLRSKLENEPDADTMERYIPYLSKLKQRTATLLIESKKGQL